jgi:P27 family predicted phage terminase small subunit
MMTRRGRKPILQAGTLAGAPLGALPRCPSHLCAVARKEWRRLATPLHAAGILSLADRGALAAYCQAWARWVEAEQKLKETPMLIRTPSGYAQQSPWLSIANKQLELMGRYMSELGLTPVARARLPETVSRTSEPLTIVRVLFRGDDDTRQGEAGGGVDEGRGLRVTRSLN